MPKLMIRIDADLVAPLKRVAAENTKRWGLASSVTREANRLLRPHFKKKGRR